MIICRLIDALQPIDSASQGLCCHDTAPVDEGGGVAVAAPASGGISKVGGVQRLLKVIEGAAEQKHATGLYNALAAKLV